MILGNDIQSTNLKVDLPPPIKAQGGEAGERAGPESEGQESCPRSLPQLQY